jgi:hypothetical protein
MAAKAAAVTAESLIEQAEEVRKRAMEGHQFSAAISAIREMGVLSGMRIERKEVGPPGAFREAKRSTDQSFIAAAANGLTGVPTTECPLSGVKRTLVELSGMSTNDPKRTSPQTYLIGATAKGSGVSPL